MANKWEADTFKSVIFKIIFLFIFIELSWTPVSRAQESSSDDPSMKIYRATAPRINNLIHTRLVVSFDYKKRYLYGKEWVTIKPHIYPTDSLRLDAKGMDLHNIAIVKNGKNIPLKYKYVDSLSVAIQLDKVYNNNESYTIYINYTAKPNNLKTGRHGIIRHKALFFINPDGTEKNKPTQVWTQSETESASVWFPTIDKPNQKSTEEISMTVPSKYVTLSNGRLASQRNNADGTRTDTWKMDLPHAPYLFMMAVGDFKIYHGKWRNKEVNYYLEPEYAPYAREIFGMTPEIMEFYSKLLGVDFPWNKYAQVVVRDHPGGAMENTSATLHSEIVQETSRELIDANYDVGRQTIAHELFHQWFGDYVTSESWSNLTVNESFADFSQMLWAAHKYGRDEADAVNYAALQNYLSSPDAHTKNLVRFYYHDREDTFDAIVTYNKGGRILNMLRNYLGDAAFFKGLNIYLKTNAFKTAEAHQVRLAMEEASGLDLNWFFNQWYYGAGHPILNISYKWDNEAKTETVYLQQTQQGQIFRLPMAIDIYADGKKERHKIWMNDKTDTLTLHVASKPELVNVDGDKVLLAEKKDNKTLQELVFQYFNAPLYQDRLEAIDSAANHQNEQGAQKVLIAALQDKYYGLRIKAVTALDMSNDDIHSAAIPILTLLAQTDKNTLVRAAAISVLGQLKVSAYLPLYKQALSNKSYAVEGAALNAIALLDAGQAITLAKNFESDNKGELTKAIVAVYAKYGNSKQWPYIYNTYNSKNANNQYRMIADLAAMTSRIDTPAYVQQGINALAILGTDFKQFGLAPKFIKLLNDIKIGRSQLNDVIGAKAADDAIKQINDAK
ncbi:M1 family metallopeptidase [Mucilaginibacter sp.]|uniref:M1 family metallopeptidase n=1 Tax=Mucilaginibacter sp. TaxID=1882438 RepID=UPI0025D81503|nr:M1 family metallopeptidase [Mucilaginibacter sp.]